MKTRSLRILSIASALLLTVALLAAPQAQAQADFKLGPRLTADQGDISDADGSNLAFGVDARIRSEDFPIQGNGSFDYYPVDENLTLFTFDVNLVYLFIGEDQSFTPYAGLGLGATRISSEADVVGIEFAESSTELGVNLVGGAEFHLGGITPFAQAQFTNGEDVDRFGITGGLLFDL